MPRNSTRRLELLTRGIIGALTATSLVIIWTAFLASTLGEREKNETLQGERIQRSALAFAMGMGHSMGDAHLALDLLVGQIAAHPTDDALQSPEFLSLVKVVRIRSQNVDIRGVTRDGQRVVFGEPASVPPVILSDRPYFTVQHPYPGVGFYVDAPVISRANGLWVLVMSQASPPDRGALAVLYAALEFPRINAFVEALSDSPSEVMTAYRDDGTPLYQHPIPAAFPNIPGRSVLEEIHTTGLESGLLGGKELRAFRKVADAPVWVVVTRPASALAQDWDRWFVGQLVWVSLLTLALLGSMVLLLWLLGQLRQIRLNQESLARLDPLTGLLNRRAFLEQCDGERVRSQRHSDPLTLLLLDLDQFKLVNDRFGHQEGDRVLRDFSAVLVKTLRTSDTLARTGGEEFAVLLPSTGSEAGLETAERLRAEVETIALPQGRQTTSIGVAVWDGAETFDNWYQRADQALYRAKTSGRNRVEAAS